MCDCNLGQSCPKCKELSLANGIGPKFDQGKLRYSLVPPVAIKAIADVLTYGAEKYAPNSWQTVPNAEERYTDALYRHLESYRAGEELDDESKRSHLAHALTNISFLLHYQQERLDAKS